MAEQRPVIVITKEDIGKRVRARRRELDLTQKALAAKCGFGYQIISGLEHGRQSVYAERLGIIAQVLGVSAGYLLGLEPKERGQCGKNE
jgi:transcriptional regulator with XRE-family HTH domain